MCAYCTAYMHLHLCGTLSYVKSEDNCKEMLSVCFLLTEASHPEPNFPSYAHDTPLHSRLSSLLTGLIQKNQKSSHCTMCTMCVIIMILDDYEDDNDDYDECIKNTSADNDHSDCDDDTKAKITLMPQN